MKKIVFLLLLVTVACTDDSFNTTESKLSQNIIQLKSRTINYYENGQLTDVIKETYSDEKLTKSEASDGRYTLYEYQNGLLDRAMYYKEEGILSYTLDYTYDAEGRLTNRFSIPESGEDNLAPVERIYSYCNDKITGIIKFYDQQLTEVLSDTIFFDTNAEGLITRSEKKDPSEGSWGAEITYQDNNAETFTYYGWRTDFEGVAEYSYTNDIRVNVYPKSKLLFGQHWRNNQIFDGSSVLNHSFFMAVGDKYMKGYSHWNLDKTELKEEVTVEYEFDVEGNLVRRVQVEKNHFLNRTLKYDITYRYQ